MEPQGLSDAARDIMMRGGVPGNATQWVARVAKGLEAHYRTLQREDGVRIAMLESRLVRQERELAEARATTKAEMDARLAAEAEALLPALSTPAAGKFSGSSVPKVEVYSSVTKTYQRRRRLSKN